jgi:DNA-binding response OmpR family regulator
MVQKANKKILIVEDDEDFISILRTKFEKEGFPVVTAENGEMAVAVAEKEKPDLIISDILMPKMDGIEMAKKIKEFNKDVMIVFLTNIKDVDYTKGIEKLTGFDYWIKSDLPIDEIVGRVRAKLGLNKTNLPPVPNKDIIH